MEAESRICCLCGLSTQLSFSLVDLNSHLSMSQVTFSAGRPAFLEFYPVQGQPALFALVGHIQHHSKEPGYSAWVISREANAVFFLKYNVFYIHDLRIEICDIRTAAHVNRDFPLKLSDKKVSNREILKNNRSVGNTLRQILMS